MGKAKKKGSKNKFLVKFVVWFATFFLTVLFTQELLFSIGPLKSLELRLIDERFVRRGEIDIKDSADVIILEITKESHEQIEESWPWPRSVFARVIDNLNEAGVRAVGLDLVMSKPDDYSPINDSLLHSAIKKHKNVVVAGELDTEEEAEIAAYQKGEKEYYGQIIQFTDTSYSNLTFNFNNIFFHADSSIGIVLTTTDYDKVIRRIKPVISSSRFTPGSDYTAKFPAFSYALINKYYGLSKFNTVKISKDHFLIHDKEIPRFDASTVLINYYGAAGTFPHIEFSRVLDDSEYLTVEEKELEVDINYWDDPDIGLQNQGIFKDKIVIIGSTMAVDKDHFNIPISATGKEGGNMIYGVEFHANAIQNVLWNDFLTAQSQSFGIFSLLILSLLIFYGSSFIKQKKIKHHFLLEIVNILFVVITIFAIYELGFYLFINNQYVISLVSPLLAVILAYFSSTAYNFISERSQSKMIKGMFSHYVSGSLVNELLQDPDKLKLGGEKRNLTILFSDIAGFTSISERMGAEELVVFINEYLTEMTTIVINNNGTLDKYIGDAVMAFWGAPLPMKDHAIQACKTAVEMQKRLAILRGKWDFSEDQQIQIRIGLNTGDVVVGNIGGQNRFDYTVMGDTVNLASRLEGANKQYGTLNMVSEHTYEVVKNEIVARELDNIRVKGKEKPTRVYELIGLQNDDEAVQKIENLKLYFEALEMYKQSNFTQAKNTFIKSAEFLPGDSPSGLYIDRCQYYIDNPPEKDWNKVFVMKTK